MSTDSLDLYASATIEQLIAAFQAQLNPTKTTRLSIERDKLAIIQAAEKKLKQSLRHHRQQPTAIVNNAPEPTDSRFQSILRKGAFYFLLIFGLLQDIAGSYIFSSTLFALIPGITLPGIIAAAVCYTILDSILFYAFEVSFLKDALGIPYTSTDAEVLLKTYDEQITLVSSLQYELSTLKTLTLETHAFEKYLQLTQLLSDDLHNKKKSIGEYRESNIKKVIKCGLLIFGALSSIAASYFWADSILVVFGGSLIGTPIGWAIIALTIIAGLGYFYAMGGTSMIQLVNPDYEAFQKIKTALSEFQEKYEDNLKNVCSLRQSHIKPPQKDVAVETAPLPEPYTLPRLEFFPPRRPVVANYPNVDTNSDGRALGNLTAVS
jgi:hypothetical protein